MDTHGQMVVYVPVTVPARGTVRANRRSEWIAPLRGHPPPRKRQRAEDDDDQEEEQQPPTITRYVEEHAMDPRRILITYYGIDTSTTKHLKAQHLSDGMIEAFFSRMMTHSYETAVPSMFNPAIAQMREKARQTHDALEGSSIFAKTLAHSMPFMYGVSFENWDEAWQAHDASRSYMSALEVARRTLDVLDEWGELAEPELAFPRIVDAHPVKDMTLPKWKLKRPAAFSVGDAVPNEASSQGKGRATQSVDDLARKTSRWSSWNPGKMSRMIPCSILPLMFLAMCKTRTPVFSELNHPWRIMTECRLYLHRIRSLYLNANPGFTRDSIPLPIYSAMCLDDQCQSVSELLYRVPSLAPDRTVEMLLARVAALEKKVQGLVAPTAQ